MIEKFVQFFGYEKAPRDFESEEVEKIKEYDAALQPFIIDRLEKTVYLPTENQLYTNITLYAKRRGYSFEDFLEIMGYQRSLTPNILPGHRNDEQSLVPAPSALSLDGDSGILDETDMQIRAFHASNVKNIENFLGKLFAEHPLIGNRLLSEINAGIIMDNSKRAIERALTKNDLPPVAKMLLTVAVVHIVKDWKYEDVGRFWYFIAEQLGFKDDEGKIYAILTDAIEYTMKFQNRFFIAGNIKRDFYTTILAHAFSPRKSLFAFFDLLFVFYKDNLQWNYIKNDAAILQLVNVLRNKMANGPDTGDDDISSNYHGIQTGIRSLILKKPVFMKGLVEETIRKIDKLFSAETFKKSTYLDELLNEWFSKKIVLLGETARHGRKKRQMEIVMDYDRIRVHFELDNFQDIVLSIPCIRLKKDIAEEPYALLHVGESIRK
jgi:hypothetical protein